MSADAALALLRYNPEEACKNYGFVVEYDPNFFFTHFGGKCKITASLLNDNVIKLYASMGGNDYFFPYTHLGGPAGRVQVPAGVDDGTLVLTGGMNGCSLQVMDHGNYKMFYHDANADQLAQEDIDGEQVCRLNYRDYDGPLEMGEKVTSSEWPYFLQTLLSVKVAGNWKVFHTGIIKSMDFKYSTYTSTITPLLASFDD